MYTHVGLQIIQKQIKQHSKEKFIFKDMSAQENIVGKIKFFFCLEIFYGGPWEWYRGKIDHVKKKISVWKYFKGKIYQGNDKNKQKNFECQ